MNTKTKLIALASAAALTIGSITGCSTTSKPPDDTPAQKRQNIDAAVDAAFAQLYASDPASRDLVAKSRGVLVFPSVVSAGFVVGGSYGHRSAAQRQQDRRLLQHHRSIGRPVGRRRIEGLVLAFHEPTSAG